MTTDPGTTPLQLMISSTKEPGLPSSIPLRVTFVNRSQELIRVLDEFEPIPVFFSFHVLRSNGTPVILPGGGKIDFGPDPLRYLELQPGMSHNIDLNLGKLLTAPLDPGAYSVSSIYHNQYGDRCFRGRVKSNTITIDVVRSREMIP